jgi:hypothetical protein
VIRNTFGGWNQGRTREIGVRIPHVYHMFV